MGLCRQSPRYPLDLILGRKQIVRINFSTSELLNLGQDHSWLWGCLGTMGCCTACQAHSQSMQVMPCAPRHNNHGCPQTLPNVSRRWGEREAGFPQVRTTELKIAHSGLNMSGGNPEAITTLSYCLKLPLGRLKIIKVIDNFLWLEPNTCSVFVWLPLFQMFIPFF